jgi:Na+-driven multidrug efflux pump
VVYGITRSLLNIVLDWIMIFGKFGFPAMGIEGAALATAIAEYVGGFFIMAVFVFEKRLNTRPSFKAILGSKFSSYITSAKLGLNTALEDLLWNIGNMVLISVLNTIDEMAAGIYSIIFGIEILAVVIISALGSATMTLTGEAKGKRDRHQYIGVCINAYICCVAVAVCMLVVSLLFPQQVLSLFTGDENIIVKCGIYLVVISLNLFGKSANIIVGNTIRGSGDTKWMLKTQMFGTVWVICMASLLVFVFRLQILGVFLAVLLDELTRAFINIAKLRRILKQDVWGSEKV